MTRIRIVVVDDHEVVRHGLRLSLELEPDMAVIGEARTGEDALRIVRDSTPDVVLLDVRLEGADGPEVCRRILEVVPRTAGISPDEVAVRMICPVTLGSRTEPPRYTERIIFFSSESCTSLIT